MAGVSREALLQAFALRRDNRNEEAEAAFRSLLAAEPRHPEVLHGISLVAQASGRLPEAIGWARQAVLASPGHPGLHYTLGVMLDDSGDPGGACLAFSEATRLKPDFFQAWNNLGLVLESLGRREDAKHAYQSALAVDPAYATALANLGSLRLGMGDNEGALADFRRILARDSANAPASRKEAQALIALKRLDEARSVLEALLAARADDRKAIELIAQACADMNDNEEAVQWCRRLVAADPGDWAARMEAGLSLRAIHASKAVMATARERFAAGLRDLLAVAESPPGSPAQRLRGVERINFLLAYQGEDDRALQADYARLVRGLLAPMVQEGNPATRSHREGRRRIGFASCFFRDCTVGHYFKSWIVDLDAGRFEKFLYNLGAGEDALTAELRQSADHYRRLGGSLPEAASAILQDDLDLLVFPELGMNGRTFALGALRLAPVQCVGWGHPVTSGHASIDFFLSSELMEPEDGEAHYTERLIRLPGLGTRYARSPVGIKLVRSDLGLPEDAHLYFFPHALFKIHPENDSTVARILAEDPAGLLVLCAGENRWMTKAFLNRLGAALERNGVGLDRVRMLPSLSRSAYLEANRLCDVMLDTTRWSGGNTSLDALAAGLPIVSRWGRFMRGRQSAGMLGRLGLPELIARDEPEYVNIALRLGCDKSWREEVSRRIVANHGRLFDDPEPVAALESFLLDAQHRLVC